MKSFRRLAVVVPVVVAAMAFVPQASGTSLTSPAGTSYTGSVKAESIIQGLYVYSNGTLQETCDSEFDLKAESHGAAVTTLGSVTGFTTSECSLKITLLKPGSFEIHTFAEGLAGSGTITWIGPEITVASSLDCKYKLEKAYVANLTGSNRYEGKTATVDFEAIWAPTGGLFCFKTEWKSFYSVTSPDYLLVD